MTPTPTSQGMTDQYQHPESKADCTVLVCPMGCNPPQEDWMQKMDKDSLWPRLGTEVPEHPLEVRSQEDWREQAENAILIGFASGYVTCQEGGRPDDMSEGSMKVAMKYIESLLKREREDAEKRIVDGLIDSPLNVLSHKSIQRIKAEEREKAIEEVIEELEGEWALTIAYARNGEATEEATERAEYEAAIQRKLIDLLRSKFLKPNKE